jgi:hypothetical protein
LPNFHGDATVQRKSLPQALSEMTPSFRISYQMLHIACKVLQHTTDLDTIVFSNVSSSGLVSIWNDAPPFELKNLFCPFVHSSLVNCSGDKKTFFHSF